MNRLLFLLAVLATSIAQAVTITSAGISGYSSPGYIISADASDGNFTTNRHRISTSADIDFGSPPPGDVFSVQWDLLDPSGTVVETSSTSVTSPASGPQTITGSITPSTRLAVGTLYRVKTTVLQNSVAVVASTEATGNTFIHLSGTAANTSALNVVSEVNAVAINRTWLLDTDTSRRAFPVSVNYTLYRYDHWSSAGAATTDSVPVTLTAALIRVSDNSVIASTSTGTSITPSIDEFTGGIIKTPATTTGSTTIFVDPSSVIAPDNYLIQVTIAHQDDNSTPLAGNAVSSSSTFLLDFSGTVKFGTTTPINTTVDSFSAPPALYGGAPPDVAGVEAFRTITVGSAVVNGSGGTVTYTGTFNVRLGSAGNASVLSGSTTASGGTGADSINGVDFTRGTITLDTTGAHASLTATLPVGVGWASTRDVGLLESTVNFGTQDLTQTLDPTGTASVSFAPGTFYLCEETKPVYIEATNFTWIVSTGDFSAGASASAYSIRKPLMDFLQSFAASYSDPLMNVKRSNDHFYNQVTTATNVSFRTGSSGGGEMTADLSLGSTAAFITHFPWNVPVLWGVGTHVVRVAGDLIDPVGSKIEAPLGLITAYQQHCQDSVESGCGAEQTANLTLTPSTALNFTKDGGLQVSGSVSASLAWGWNSLASSYAHQVTSTFTNADFLMAGTFLRGDQNALSDEDGPGVLLLTGFDPLNLSTAERPQTTAYDAGLGDYAGHNFRASTFASPPLRGHSTLQGTSVGDYDLTSRSKYYARYSGVTGIHESPTGPGGLTMGGFVFNLSTFGFSFLSNEMEDSRTSGVIDLPSPTDFTLDLQEVRFNCIGALESAELSSASSAVDCKEFNAWDALFTPMAVSFFSDNGCNPAAGGCHLILGFSAHASHVEEAFAGSLGIEPTGHFTTGATTSELPTRLQLPGSFKLVGTTGETYSFSPSQGAYLNDDPTGAGDGCWNIFGKLDVPFFEDIQVNVQLSCGTATPGDTEVEKVSSIYFMGGWDGPTSATGWYDGTASPYTTENFDDAHRGYPSTTTLTNYRLTTAETYLPRAQKLWLGVVNFDYPVVWSNTAFNFTGFAPITTNLLVLSTEHQLKFMDANNCEITFGVQYDGLPQISVSNFVFNALDDATGVSSAMVTAAGDAVFRSLENGVDDFTKMLSDKAEDMIKTSLDSVMQPVIGNFIAAAKTEINNGTWAANKATLLANYFTNASSQMNNALKQLATSTTSATNFFKDLDSNLAQIQQAIDAVINTVNTDPDTGAALSSALNGLLKQVDVGGGVLERQVFHTLATTLIDVLSTAVSSSDVDEQIESVLSELEPQLDAVVSALTQVRDLIQEVRDQLDPAIDMGKEITDIITAASAQLQAASAAAATKAESLFDGITDEDEAYLNDLAGDFSSEIAQELTDAIFGSQFVADIQEAIKERIYDLQSAFNSAVDTAFAALNSMIREALSGALAALDDKINGMLGSVASSVGSGSLTGFAHINGDSLDEARIDGKFKLSVPDDLTLAAYLEIKELDSDGPADCAGTSGAPLTEVTIGALDIPLGWVGVSGDDLKANLGVKFALDSSTGMPQGLGGSFELTSGEISFETFKITDLGAAAMFGATENYFAANISMEFGEYAMSGGVFFGKACSIDPLEMIDPLVAEVLTMPTFTGVYCYGEATFPIYGTGTCFFNISGKAGAGVFYFTEGPTFGGRLTLGVYEEALCAVEVGGEVSLVGAKSGSSYSFAGTGSVYGKAGVCPICVEANFSAHFNYTDAGGWQVEF